MSNLTLNATCRANHALRLRRTVVLPVMLLVLGLLSFLTGCSALHPVRGVPAAYLPDQFMGTTRDDKRTIDLSLLVRSTPDQHRVAAGDVLSIYIPRVLGTEPTDVNTVGISPPINMPASNEDPPTVGFPIHVRDDNTISLPQIPPMNVGGMTLYEVERAIYNAYTSQYQILNPTDALVMVSLHRARVTRVMVVRQEANSTTSVSTGAGAINIGKSGKGTARTVTLKAYENDVLHALARAEGVDGLPGLDAENAIYVIRRRQSQPPVSSYSPTNLQQFPTENGYSPAYQQMPIYQQPPAYQHPAQPLLNAPLPMGSETSMQQPWNPAQNQPGMYSEPVQQPVQQVVYRGQSPAGQGRGGSGYGASAPVAGGHSFGPTSSYRNASAMPESMTPVQQSRRPSPPVRQAAAASGPQNNGHRPVSPSPNQSGRGVQQTRYDSPAMMGLPAGGASADLSPIADPSMGYGQPSYDPMNGGQFNGNSVGAGSDDGSLRRHWSSVLNNFDSTIDNPSVIRIPIRLGPGEAPNISEESITLYDGDIIFIESRETEVFYTAGLLGGGQYTLPRDYDLNVLEAVSIAESKQMGGGQVIRSMGGVSALNQDISASASRLAIIRTLPNGQRVTLEVDLKKAMRMREENIRIQPGDVLVLQYTFSESIGAFTQRYLLEGAIFGLAAGMATGR